jgi:redox-sensitive bicupin YhaK (pirin superfamily)
LGSITANQCTPVHNSQFIIFEKEGQNLLIKSNQDSSLLLLAGEPLNEPIVGYGPFVMNTEKEIHDAIHDFNSGKFGVIN